jgi:hypothetical protein
MNDLRLQLITRALDGLDQLPAAERADYYDAAAGLLINTHSHVAVAIAATARALREANAAQLLMSSLLRSAESTPAH